MFTLRFVWPPFRLHCVCCAVLSVCGCDDGEGRGNIISFSDEKPWKLGKFLSSSLRIHGRLSGPSNVRACEDAERNRILRLLIILENFSYKLTSIAQPKLILFQDSADEWKEEGRVEGGGWQRIEDSTHFAVIQTFDFKIVLNSNTHTRETRMDDGADVKKAEYFLSFFTVRKLMNLACEWNEMAVKRWVDFEILLHECEMSKLNKAWQIHFNFFSASAKRCGQLSYMTNN